MAIVDTGFWVALANPKDNDHVAAIRSAYRSPVEAVC